MVRIVPCVISELYGNFDGNPVIHFPVMLLPDTDSPQNGNKKSCIQGVTRNIFNIYLMLMLMNSVYI